MVTVLPQKTNAGSQLGQAIGQGLQSGLQRGTQWGMSNAALDQLQEQASQPGQTAQSLLFNLIKASQFSPEIGRSLGMLYQTLLNRQASPATEAIRNVSGGAGANVGQQAQQAQSPSQLSQEGQRAQEKPSSTEGTQSLFPTGEVGSLGTYLPDNIGKLVTPEQRQEAVQKAISAGQDAALVGDNIDKYNQGVISLTELRNANIDRKAAQFQRQLALENQVRQEIDKQLPKDTPQSNKNLYYNMVSKEVAKNKDFTSAFQAVSKKIADYEKLQQSWISKIPSAGLYGFTDAQEKQLRNSAKPLLKTDPLAYNILESAILNADKPSATSSGNSIVDASLILKPLSQDVKNVLSNAEDHRESLYPKPSFNPFAAKVSDRQMLARIGDAQESQTKQIPELAKQLSNQWSEDISLINIYAELSKKGWFPEQINELFHQLSDKLTSQQQTEMSQLTQHPKIPVKFLLQ